MRPSNTLPLDHDILDQILTFCPTFGTLQAAILTSKTFYRVFQTHPKSITSEVTYNVLGPAFPSAIRVVRYPYADRLTSNVAPAIMATACPETNVPTIITAEEQKLLQENHRVVTELEDIYSLMNKDEKSKTSTLTAEESHRFRRAMYRLMLYCKIFAAERYAAEVKRLDDGDVVFQKIQQQRIAVLSEYPTDELLEFFSATRFLFDIFNHWSDEFLSEVYMNTGPHGAFRAWSASPEDDLGFSFAGLSEANPFFYDWETETDNFYGPLTEIWKMRNAAEPEDDSLPSSWILDSVNSTEYVCSQCGASGELYTETNWSLFRILPYNLLKPNLQGNYTRDLYSLGIDLENRHVLGSLITELFTMRTEEFRGWQTTDLYCDACLIKFLGEHVWRWLLKRKIADGWSPRTNCPKGCDCKKQSITSAVTCNVLGPAFPSALRVIRYPYTDYSTSRTDPTVMATACPETNIPTIVTAEEQKTLQENSRVVSQLEDFYSLMNKDRTSKISVLTATESHRFRRAMYRVMFFCKIFAPDRYAVEIEGLDEGDVVFHRIRQQRVAVLNEYPTDELLEFFSGTRFLSAIFERWSDQFRNDVYMSTGPHGALRAWSAGPYEDLFSFHEDSDQSPFYFDFDSECGYLSGPLTNIWRKRKIAPPEDEAPASNWILDSVNGADDTCSKCGTPGDLYTEANWSRFQAWIPGLLKGSLKRNLTLNVYSATFHLTENRDLIGPFFMELFAIRTQEFETWQTTDLYCYDCLRKFVEEHMWRWLLQREIEDGWSPPQNCPKGWSCGKQRYNRRHAEAENASSFPHLCDPIELQSVPKKKANPAGANKREKQKETHSDADAGKARPPARRSGRERVAVNYKV
ncbi:hypothetical protein MSAN_01600000 [Mycena sanguinolenta]|uniref:Uncharacterized protein n=1 Tax=Mycena sanguinolenta TaxID=230812 RepID=A0A8H7CXK7_9AGAR|nr:hypothetical protein MSAN_01600000 [Mycena sanguinolenta]